MSSCLKGPATQAFVAEHSQIQIQYKRMAQSTLDYPHLAQPRLISHPLPTPFTGHSGLAGLGLPVLKTEDRNHRVHILGFGDSSSRGMMGTFSSLYSSILSPPYIPYTFQHFQLIISSERNCFHNLNIPLQDEWERTLYYYKDKS